MRAAERERFIVDEAVRFFAEQGFGGQTREFAKRMGITHSAIYRHFPSKAALRDAVTRLWLDRIMGPLEAVIAEDKPAPERLRHWFNTLISIKRKRTYDDPELFANYMELTEEAREVVKAHVEHLVDHVSRIIAYGVARGEFTVADPVAAARGILDATARFHNPIHAAEWSDPGIDEAFERVWALILPGLGADKRTI